ncbi:MAG: hypothetical protein J6W75_06810 [Bacteroidaceae bacterium]|nr:hypothetical protein [Bacteroidaceae bacterium]
MEQARGIQKVTLNNLPRHIKTINNDENKKVTSGGGAGLAKAREAPSGGVTFEGGKMGLERPGHEHPLQGVSGKICSWCPLC